MNSARILFSLASAGIFLSGFLAGIARVYWLPLVLLLALTAGLLAVIAADMTRPARAPAARASAPGPASAPQRPPGGPQPPPAPEGAPATGQAEQLPAHITATLRRSADIFARLAK